MSDSFTFVVLKLPFLLLVNTAMTLHVTNRPAPAAAEPVTTTNPLTGASAAFTSVDPIVVAARGHFFAGRFGEAGRLLDSSVGSSEGADADEVARGEMSEIIRRARREYRFTPTEILQKVRASIPDATNDDINRWVTSGELQHRMIDGEIRVFHREPGHLLRFSTEAQQRRDAASAAKGNSVSSSTPTTAPVATDWTLQQHLRDVIDAAKASDSPYVHPIDHRITYTLTVPPNPRAKAGSTLAVWLPFPQEYGRQKNVKLLFSDPPNAVVAANAIEGSIVQNAQRTVYLERKIEDPAKPVIFRIQFAFTTSAYYLNLDDASFKPGALAPDRRSDLATYLAERPPHIVFTPEIRSRVDELIKGDPNPLSRARKIFYFLDENVRWTPEEEYCVIPNLSMHGLTRGKGDCGVASMLFITMCRAAGVPARWQSGWTTSPVGWNMHDWAEIYVEPWGWLPVDASYGRQKSDDPAVRDFYFGHADSHRLIVNLDYGHALNPPKKTLRSEPLDFQRGEVELDGKNLYFDEWDYDIEFERSPGP